MNARRMIGHDTGANGAHDANRHRLQRSRQALHSSVPGLNATITAEISSEKLHDVRMTSCETACKRGIEPSGGFPIAFARLGS